MVHLTQRINRVTMYKALDLTTAYTGKANISLLRLPNTSGTGYASNTPSAQFNAFTSLSSGQTVDIIVNTIPSGGFDFDNGTPSGGGTVTRPALPISFHLLSTEPLTTTQGQFVENMRGKITMNPASGVSVLYSLNGNSFVDEATVISAIAALDPTAIASNAYTVDMQFTRTSAVNVDVTVTMSDFF